MASAQNPDGTLSAQPTEAQTPTPAKPTPAVSEPQHRADAPVEKPVHDPSTIEVEHKDEDPNSPTYRAPETEV